MIEFDKKVREMKKLYLEKRPKNKGDNKCCIEEEWFPVTKTTGETEESVAQISKLKYVAAKKPRVRGMKKWVNREEYGKYFVGLVVKTDGKEQTGNSVINFLNPDWVQHMFSSDHSSKPL